MCWFHLCITSTIYLKWLRILADQYFWYVIEVFMINFFLHFATWKIGVEQYCSLLEFNDLILLDMFFSNILVLNTCWVQCHDSQIWNRKNRIMVGFELFLSHFEQIVNFRSELAGEICYSVIYQTGINVPEEMHVCSGFPVAGSTGNMGKFQYFTSVSWCLLRKLDYPHP